MSDVSGVEIRRLHRLLSRNYIGTESAMKTRCRFCQYFKEFYTGKRKSVKNLYCRFYKKTISNPGMKPDYCNQYVPGIIEKLEAQILEEVKLLYNRNRSRRRLIKAKNY
jgi:hypothetical protein